MEMGVTTRRVELTFAHVKTGRQLRQLREFGVDEPERQKRLAAYRVG